MTARALVFPKSETEATAPVLVAFDTKHLDYSTAGDQFSAEAVVIARIRDSNGQVLAKMSEQYTLGGASAQMANSQAGRVVFFRKPTIPPGLYQLEAIVYDTHTAKASVRISSLEVPATSAAPVRVSSLFVVQRAEKVPEADRDATNPLYFGDTLLYPNVGEPLSKASTKELGFAFAVQAGKSPVTGATMSLAEERAGRGPGAPPAGEAGCVRDHPPDRPVADGRPGARRLRDPRDRAERDRGRGAQRPGPDCAVGYC